jgi:hypothetical protein
MKNSIRLFTLFVLALASVVHADVVTSTYKTQALVRQGQDLVQQQVTLTDLVSTTSFQGKYFTVIDGEGNTPIAFNSDPELCLKAATAYNAFTESRNYFVNALASIIPTLSLAQQNYLNQNMVIRLDMTHLFSAEIHFDQVDTTANGAVTVPASDDFRIFDKNPDGTDKYPAWGVETWFFVAKSEKTPNAASQIPAVLNNSAFKVSLFESLAQNDSVTAIQNVELGTYSTQVLAEDLLVSLGLAEGLTPIMAKAITIIPGHVYLDAVMIPEIGANEYAHYALYPWLGLQRRFPVGEGYAHYFASKITGLVKLQNKAGKYSKGYQAITGNSKGVYGFANELGPTAASSSFTFSLLDDLEKSLGTNGLPVIVGTIPLLNDSSNLRIDFSQSVMASISSLDAAQGKSPIADLLQAQKVLTLRGM